MIRATSIMLLFAAVLMGVSCGSSGESRENTAADSGTSSSETVSVDGLPVLLDLGSTTCVPCRMMVDELAMLDSLTGTELEIRFIDVNANSDEASEYAVRVIPTQLFISETGEELFRHEGFISCDDMLARWSQLGYLFQQAE